MSFWKSSSRFFVPTHLDSSCSCGRKTKTFFCGALNEPPLLHCSSVFLPWFCSSSGETAFLCETKHFFSKLLFVQHVYAKKEPPEFIYSLKTFWNTLVYKVISTSTYFVLKQVMLLATHFFLIFFEGHAARRRNWSASLLPPPWQYGKSGWDYKGSRSGEEYAARGGGGGGQRILPRSERKTELLPSFLDDSFSKKNSHTHNIECVYIRGEGKKGWDFTNFFLGNKRQEIAWRRKETGKKNDDFHLARVKFINFLPPSVCWCCSRTREIVLWKKKKWGKVMDDRGNRRIFSLLLYCRG